MTSFQFQTATRIVFAPGAVGSLPNEARTLGERALVVTGKSPQRHQEVLSALETAGLTLTTFAVENEPTTDDAIEATRLGLDSSVELVIAIGGGSALDLGKAAAALIASGGSPLDYLEVVGKGQPLRARSLPFIAVPTTAGTGAEVTKNAVLEVPSHKVKVSLRGPELLPTLALIDPELTLSVPRDVTASTGFDALCQVIEPWLSCEANPLTDSLCLEGIKRGARSLVRAYENGGDLNARTDLCLTSLFGGLALANSKLGAVHGFAGPLGGMYRAPHGALCAALLPQSLKVNRVALDERAPAHPARARLDELGPLLTAMPHAAADDAILWCQRTARDLNIPGLSAYGIIPNDFPTIVEKAMKSSSMKGNPLVLTAAELTEILQGSL